jgi:hypothetical protein
MKGRAFLLVGIIEFVDWRTLLREAAEDKVGSKCGTIGRANNRRDRIFSKIGWQSDRAEDSAASSAAPLGSYPFFCPGPAPSSTASIFKGDPKIANWLIMTPESYQRPATLRARPPCSLFLPRPLPFADRSFRPTNLVFFSVVLEVRWKDYPRKDVDGDDVSTNLTELVNAIFVYMQFCSK